MSGIDASRLAVGLLAGWLAAGTAAAQFREDFDDPHALARWTYFTGDGAATMDLRPGDGYAALHVDAMQDRRNVWWALVKRDVAGALDLRRLAQPGYELRVEARVRPSHAPRRINLHVNTQKTVDFHSHLMEYDLPDTARWHTVSMTTRGFEAGPGDTVNVQLALIDWGLGTYRVDVDYIQVDVVEAAAAGPDLGSPIPYHPPVPPPDAFVHALPVAHDAVVDLQHPELNFNRWAARTGDGTTRLLTVSGTQYTILRWDFSSFSGRQAAGSGLLEVTTHAVQRADDSPRDFGLVRVVEIPGGDPAWDEQTVTLDRLTRGQPLDAVLNPQMIIDVAVEETRGGRTYATIPPPVLQRLLDGRTHGLALCPLGAIQAAFYAREHDAGTHAARLLFNVQE